MFDRSAKLSLVTRRDRTQHVQGGNAASCCVPYKSSKDLKVDINETMILCLLAKALWTILKSFSQRRLSGEDKV